MRHAALALLLLTLAACGAGGAPERPATPDGLTISGTAEAGIAYSDGAP